MKSIAFFGAAGEVTGSSFLLTGSDDSEYLIDLGMFQGPEAVEALNYKPLAFNPSKLKGVFLTHGHLDHCGRLPLLIYGGYFGKIYMTAPTRALVELSLNDSAHVMKQDLTRIPMYTTDEVGKLIELIEVVEYDKPFKVGSMEVTFKDAGHILGSASISLKDQAQSIVFSGDLGNTPEDIVKPTEYFDKADFVVMETTYGDKTHPIEDVPKLLQDEINIIEQKGGVLLIPSFSIERTQELLHRINHLKKDGKVKADTPVFMDSPMAIHATEIFKAFKEFYNPELHSHTDDPFSFEGLVITQDPKDSREIIRAHAPKVIIAGSGMMSGGRILHHAINYLGDPSTRILFVGYQAEETLGREILEGARTIKIDKSQIRIKAHVGEIASMSSHADSPKLLTWLEHIKGVQKVFLIHGDNPQREVFAKKVQGREVVMPKIGEEHTL